MTSTLALLAPAATATWYSQGSFEPDTPRDVSDGFMFLDPHTGAGEKIYFNAYQTEFATGTNPNSGTLGSRVLVAGLDYWIAVMGIWKDCNGDGYVGAAEGALREYRAELLTTDSVCPAGADGGLHNDGQWVREYLPVGPESTSPGNTVASNVIADPDALVWGDFGLPGPVNGGSSCPLAPLPHGTTANTGMAIRYVDCLVGKKITSAINNDVDPNGELGLRFEDPNNPQTSSSLLNQHVPESLFGNPYNNDETGFLQLDSEEDDPGFDQDTRTGGTEDRAFTTWDCSSRAFELKDPTGGSLSAVVVKDPTGGALKPVTGDDGESRVQLTDANGAYVWVAQPAFQLHNPMDSYADSLNQTFRGIGIGPHAYDTKDTSEAGGGNRRVYVGGNCDESSETTYGAAHKTAFFYADGEHEGSAQAENKYQTNIGFWLYDGANTDPTLTGALGPNTPSSLGLHALNFWNGPQWEADVIYVTTPHSINRNTLEIVGALDYTFYAYVGDTTLAKGYQVPNSGIYGSDACTAGIGVGALPQNGWVCDPTKWYINPASGKDSYRPHDARVGQAYQLRDIDCLDGQLIEGVPVYTSLTPLSEKGVCKPVPTH